MIDVLAHRRKFGEKKVLGRCYGGCADPKLRFRLVGELHDCFLLQGQNLRSILALFIIGAVTGVYAASTEGPESKHAPVLMVMDAMDEHPGKQIRVLGDEAHTRTNIERTLEYHGKEEHTEVLENGCFTITFEA